VSDRPTVFVTRRLPGDGLDRLGEVAQFDVWPEDGPPPREVLLERVRDLDGLLCLLTDTIDAELLDAASKLKLVSTMAVGYDNIDVAAATERGVLVCHTPGVLTETTADLAFALLLAAARRVVEGDRAVRAGAWPTWKPDYLLGVDVWGATLGIVGLGAIGQAVARRASGFGMRILYSSRSREPDAERDLGCEHATFEELLEQADFVSAHVPLTEETRDVFDKAAFGRMKPTAIFINTARGGIVNEGDLEQALASGVIAGAAIDVAQVEPMAGDHPLLKLPNLVVTPHIGSASVATRTRMADMAVDNLIAGLHRRKPAHCLNPQILD